MRGSTVVFDFRAMTCPPVSFGSCCTGVPLSEEEQAVCHPCKAVTKHADRRSRGKCGDSAGKECCVVSSGAEPRRLGRIPGPERAVRTDRRIPTMSQATMRYGTSPRVARRSIHAVREGITVGLLGAAIVMLWFFLADLAAG